MNYVRLLTLAVADFPAAIGMELMNEPPTVDSAALYQLFHECHDAVRAISPDMAVGVMDFVSCHGIAAIWVAFFSRCQRYRVADRTRIPTSRMTRGCQLRRGLGYGMPPACFTPGMCVAMPAACPLPLPSV